MDSHANAPIVEFVPSPVDKGEGSKNDLRQCQFENSLTQNQTFHGDSSGTRMPRILLPPEDCANMSKISSTRISKPIGFRNKKPSLSDRVTFLQTFKTVRMLLLAIFLEGVVNTASRVVYFPFLRTTINCDPDTAPGFDRSSSDWSGSKHCSDRCFVAKEAQFILGITNGIENFCKFFSLPFLGIMSDTLGRNYLMTWAIAGFCISMACLSAAATFETGSLVLVLACVAYIVQGVSDAFGLGINACVSDMITGSRARGYAYGVNEAWRIFTSGVGILLITGAVIAQNRERYATVYYGFTIAGAILIPMPCLLLKETLVDPEKDISWRRASPAVIIETFREYPYIAYIGAAFFFAIFGITVLTIAPGFVIAAYGWTQTVAVAAIVLVGAFGFLSTMCAPKLIARFGNRRVLRGAIHSANFGLCVMTFSPFHPAFFILGALFVMFGLTAYPGYYALISRQVHNEDVGKTLGSLESIAIAGLAIGSPVYSTIFRAVGSGGKCGKALAKDLVWLPWALAALSMTIANFILHRWSQRFGEHHDEERDDEDGLNGSNIDRSHPAPRETFHTLSKANSPVPKKHSFAVRSSEGKGARNLRLNSGPESLGQRPRSVEMKDRSTPSR